MQYSYHGLADISPDRKHLAIGLGIGCVLETFEISSEIKCTGLKYFIKPEMPITSSNGELNYDNTIWGFGDIEISDNYIYTTYDGKKENKMHNNIAVFDLTGEPVSITCLGNNDIHRLYADEQKGNLYAAIENESGEIRIIRIKIDDILPKKQGTTYTSAAGDASIPMQDIRSDHYIERCDLHFTDAVCRGVTGSICFRVIILGLQDI